MKKYLLILSLLLPVAAFAQTDIEEHFDGSSALEWKESADKHTSAIIQNGAMVLTPKGKHIAATKTVVPIEPNLDFTIEAELFFPKYKSLSVFTIAFPNEETFILVVGNYAVTKAPSITKATKQKIKLATGKNKTVQAVLKRTGTGCTVELNGMIAGEFQLQDSYTTPELEFYAGITPMHIRSVTIKQY